jgi:ATPase family AAA domain-containing protein 1
MHALTPHPHTHAHTPLSPLPPTQTKQGAKKAAKAKKKEIQRRLGRAIDTNAYEDTIALDVINPAALDVRLGDIGGLAAGKDALYSKVIAPLERPGLFSSSLLRQAKGVLLYGPPGTGKTMLAKALAAEAGAAFINVRASTLQSKWFGDTNKLVTAVFTLAYKLQPSIIFIDEVDALLGARRDAEHEAVTAMKTEFMQLWDGFLTDAAAQVMVLAATNRPYALDDAVLRRFSVQYEVPRPDAEQREKILALILRRHVGEGGGGGVDPALAAEARAGGGPTLRSVARAAHGFAGSDLFELCSQAAAVPVHEYMAACDEAAYDGNGRGGAGASCSSSSRSSGAAATASRPARPRPLAARDFAHVMETLRPATEHAASYRARGFGVSSAMGGGGPSGSGRASPGRAGSADSGGLPSGLDAESLARLAASMAPWLFGQQGPAAAARANGGGGTANGRGAGGGEEEEEEGSEGGGEACA